MLILVPCFVIEYPSHCFCAFVIKFLHHHKPRHNDNLYVFDNLYTSNKIL